MWPDGERPDCWFPDKLGHNHLSNSDADAQEAAL